MTRMVSHQRAGRRLAAAIALSALAIAVAAACGPSGKNPTTLPLLPGEGDEHTAKPPEAPVQPPAPPDPWAGRSDLITSPAALPPAEVKLPPVVRFTLSNGLTVIVVPSREVPAVTMGLAIRAGRQQEPRDKVGLASFAASMLETGTKTRTAEKIAEAIDFTGGEMGANATFEATFVSCSVLSKDLGTCLGLLPDIVMNPTFPEAEMKARRDTLLSAVRQRKDNAGNLATAHFQNALWGDDNVRGWVMSEKTIGAISRADLIAWHKQWFKPNNAILAVAGDVDAVKLKAQLEARFGSWKRGAVPATATAAEPQLHGIHVRLVDKPDQTQSQIRIGHLGVSLRDPDYSAVEVMNYTLGGGAFASRMMQVVRAQGGKTYGASTDFDGNLSRGAFMGQTFTRNAETVATIKLMIGEIRRMAASGPTEAELSDAKTNITGSYALQFESSDAVASALLAAELHGFDEAYVRGYALQIGAVTLDQAKQAAAKRLDADNLVVVIVGAAKDVEPQLEAAGWEYEKVDYLAPITRWEREAPAEAPPKVDAAAEAAARKVLDEALAAKGGEKALRAVTSMTLEGKLTVKANGQEFEAQVKRVWVAPDKMRLDMNITAYKVVISTAIGPGGGWTRQAMGDKAKLDDVSPSDLDELRAQLWRDQELILLRHREPGTVVHPNRDETMDGVAYTVITVQRGDGKATTKLYIDKKTKLIARMAYVEGGVEAGEVLSDYRTVDGIKFAFKRHTDGPQGSLDSEVTSVKLNEKVDDAVFAKPAQ